MSGLPEKKYATPADVALEDDEPFFLIRGKDLLAPHAVAAYAELLRKVGQDGQAEHVEAIAVRMLEWAAKYPDLMKVPD